MMSEPTRELPSDEKNGSEVIDSNMSSQMVYKSTSEYFAALEKWLQEAYMWQCVMSSFPYMFMSKQFLPPIHNASGQPFPNNPSNFNILTFNTPNIPYAGYVAPNANSLRNRHTPMRQNIRPQAQEGVEYKIPPLWKRFIAEFVDFLLLFILKLTVTLIAVDFFDFIDVDKYDFEKILHNMKIDYKLAMEMTSEILLLEVVHRIVVCIFEAFCLQRGINGRAGGATPGKALMGIRVLLCHKVTPVEGRPADYVLVHPGTDLGWGWAFARSFIKNLILSVLFPICFALFFFKHNRTGYDVVCHSIVVEDNPQIRP